MFSYKNFFNLEPNKKDMIPTTTVSSTTSTTTKKTPTTKTTTTTKKTPTTTTTMSIIDTSSTLKTITTKSSATPDPVPSKSPDTPIGSQDKRVDLKDSTKVIIGVMIFILMLVAVIFFGVRCKRKQSVMRPTMV